MRLHRFRPRLFGTIICMAGLCTPAQAQLTAEESDPNRLGWMKGFPPPADKLIGQPESNYFSFPKLRWTVCHMRELLPTCEVSRGLGAPVPLPRALVSSIDSVQFTPLGASVPMTWEQSLAANYTDGIVVMHQGHIVYERYFGCLDDQSQHAAMSMTKSLTGLLAEILVTEGRLDDRARVATIIPELASSAFGDATVRQVMDMTTALDFSEDYDDPHSQIWAYSAAANPLPKPADYKGPVGYFQYLQTVKKKGAHGEAFGYRTVNSDTLGWIISRVTDKSVNQLVSERLWQPMGTEQAAYYTVDALGIPYAGGGLSAGLRDMARVGQLMLNEGEYDGKRLFPAEVVRVIRAGGDKQAFAKAGYSTLPGASYRAMWWVLHNANGAFTARGVHGQSLYIDPTADMVIARFASHPSAKNSDNDPTSLPAYQALADHLMKSGKR